MYRWQLITKEAMEKYTKGEEDEKDSVNDDLESFFENIRLGKEPDETVWTYFLPKLTKEELELVERRDTSYLQTFFVEAAGKNADVDETEMMLSESDWQNSDLIPRLLEIFEILKNFLVILLSIKNDAYK